MPNPIRSMKTVRKMTSSEGFFMGTPLVHGQARIVHSPLTRWLQLWTSDSTTRPECIGQARCVKGTGPVRSRCDQPGNKLPEFGLTDGEWPLDKLRIFFNKFESYSRPNCLFADA